MVKFAPYNDYKPSGVEWLGDIPVHWGVAAVKRHYSIQLGKMLQNHPNSSADVEVPYLKAQHVQWFSVRITDAPKMWASPHEIEQFGIQAGDLLVCEGGEGGRCALVEEVPPGYIIQNALHRVRSSGTCRNDYLQYVMNLIAQSGWFDAINNKATIAHFTVEKFGSLMIPFPPLFEQTAIVRYLDQADERIRHYVSSRERLIELLEEYRQAVIHHAVTRGLDPNVRLKPSGVEWLGDVPAHWEVRRVKQVAQIQGGFAFPADSFGNEGVPVVRMNNIRRGVLDLENVVRIPEHQCKDAFALKEGDIIYGLSGSIGATGSLGNYAIVRKGDIPAQLNQRVARFRLVIDRITGGFLVESLQTSVFYDQVLSHTTGTAQFNVSTNDIGNVALALPPVEEQRRIVRHLSITTANINASINRARREIELLSEYRTRLIADVVTGKVNVREAVVDLPDDGDVASPDFDEIERV